MEHNIMPAVLIDVNLFWQIINFIILMWIFKRYLFGPISKIISERRDAIAKDLSDATINKEVAEEQKLEAELVLKKAKTESNRLLVEAERNAEARRDKIIKEAIALREKMIKTGEAEVEKLKEAATKELQVYARQLISDFTEKLIANKTPSNLLDEAIEKVGEVE